MAAVIHDSPQDAVHEVGNFYSLYFPLQFIKHRRDEKLASGHIQAVAVLLNQVDRNLLAAR